MALTHEKPLKILYINVLCVLNSGKNVLEFAHKSVKKAVILRHNLKINSYGTQKEVINR